MKVRIAIYRRPGNKAVAVVRTPDRILWTSKPVSTILIGAIQAEARRWAEAKRYELVKEF